MENIKKLFDDLSDQEKMAFVADILGIKASEKREEKEEVDLQLKINELIEKVNTSYTVINKENASIQKYDSEISTYFNKVDEQVKNANSYYIDFDAHRNILVGKISPLSNSVRKLEDECKTIVRSCEELISMDVELDWVIEERFEHAKSMLPMIERKKKSINKLFEKVQNLGVEKKEKLEVKNEEEINEELKEKVTEKDINSFSILSDEIFEADEYHIFENVFAAGKSKQELEEILNNPNENVEIIAGYVDSIKNFMAGNDSFEEEEINKITNLKSAVSLLNSKGLTAKDFKTEKKEKFAKKVVGIKQAGSNLLDKMKEKKNVCIAAGIAIAVAVGAIINPALLPYAVAYGAMGFAANEVRKGFKK